MRQQLQAAKQAAAQYCGLQIRSDHIYYMQGSAQLEADGGLRIETQRVFLVLGLRLDCIPDW